MKAKRKSSRLKLIAAASVGVALVIVVAMGALIKSFVKEDPVKMRKQIQMVTVMKPPPPPKPPEKPPEPEIKKEVLKKEEFNPEMLQNQPVDPGPQKAANEPPASQNLGLDAEGGAGSDSFGLVGNKGGRALLGTSGGGSGNGRGTLMQKYGWYAQIIQEEVKKGMLKLLDDEGGIPKGKHQADIKISLGESGVILKYEIVGSSGSSQVDDAILKVLAKTTISRPPPDGMPRTMGLRISSQG